MSRRRRSRRGPGVVGRCASPRPGTDNTCQGRQTHHDTHEQNTLRESGGVRLVVSSSRLSNEAYEQRELIQLVEDTSREAGVASTVDRADPHRAQAELEIQGAACSCPPPPNRLCGDDDSGNSARAEPATTEGDAIERVNTGSVF